MNDKVTEHEDSRLKLIIRQLKHFADADFSNELLIAKKGDSIDSIIAGLNRLGVELKTHIDQNRQRESELKEALDRLNEAQHLAQIGSWVWNIPENKIEWTDELYRLYGLERGSFETSYENYLSLIHPDDREYANEVIRKALLNHQPFEFYHRVIRRDGLLCTLHSRGTVYSNDKGQPVKMAGTAQDVTEMKESETRTHTLAAIVESSSDAIISKTLTGHIASWNRKAEEIFGYPADEVIGKHVSILFPDDKLHEEEAIMQEIRENRSLINYETLRKRKDGTKFNVAITISPILDAQKKIIGVSKVARDITDKKRNEERLQRYTQELEYKNNESRQFTYIASHDLQEPLRTITNYIGLLSANYKGRLDSQADMYLKFIMSGATRMQTLIKDLLEYSRIENDIQVKDIDLGVLIRSVLENMQAAIIETAAVISIDHLPVIQGYEVRLTSLFQNLVSNAIKFRKKDAHPVIHISAEEKKDAWLFSVKDNGIGIEKEYFEKIFMLFQRLHDRKLYEGSGIGLSHCKKIAELSGGTITVESEPGNGSTFYVLLPKKIHV